MNSADGHVQPFQERGFPHADCPTDLAHMRYVHRWDEIPEIALWREDGPVLRVDYDGLISTPKGSVRVATENTACGVGLTSTV